MATVYLARDLKHDRPVALKVLHPELAAALGPERFLREIRIAARLRHPHIVPLYDSGEADGLLYYVMPYVEGESLRDRLRRERQLPVDEALGIARAVGSAATTQLTATGLAIGTPAYMSPEQALGDAAIDARSDVYALGCVLYEILAGDPPFAARTAQASIARRLSEPVPRIRHIRDAVPVCLEGAKPSAGERGKQCLPGPAASAPAAASVDRVRLRRRVAALGRPHFTIRLLASIRSSPDGAQSTAGARATRQNPDR